MPTLTHKRNLSSAHTHSQEKPDLAYPPSTAKLIATRPTIFLSTKLPLVTDPRRRHRPHTMKSRRKIPQHPARAPPPVSQTRDRIHTQPSLRTQCLPPVTRYPRDLASAQRITPPKPELGRSIAAFSRNVPSCYYCTAAATRVGTYVFTERLLSPRGVVPGSNRCQASGSLAAAVRDEQVSEERLAHWRVGGVC